MKKFLLLVLSLSVLAVLSACSDSGSSNNGGAQAPAVTKPDITNPNSFVGTYEVISFKTTADIGVKATIATDCTGEGEGCSVATMYGSKFTVELVNDNLVAESQMQMYADMIKTIAPNDVYQYVKYANMPLTQFEGMTDATTPKFTGVSGRNLTKETNNPQSTFTFTVNADGTITNNLTLVDKEITGSKVNADTVVTLRKISDSVNKINANDLPVKTFSDPAVRSAFDGFKKTPNPIQ